MIKNIIFDFYGTLVDIETNESKEGFFEKVEELFRNYKDFNGKLKELYIAKCLEKQKEIEEIELLDVFKELYDVDDEVAYKIALTFRLLSLEKIHLYKGVEKLMKYLNKNNYNVYLLSNAQKCFTAYEMYALDIIKYFNAIYLSSDYGVKKPNPLFFNKLINDNNLDVNETIMIGNDANCDIKGAKNVGLKTIYLETETSTKGIMKPDVEGFNYKKIIKLIKKYNKMAD